MNAEPRTAVLNILVTKALEIDEPDWCKGHDDDHAGHKGDITHYGHEHVFEINGFQTATAMFARSPYSPSATRDTVLYVESGYITGSYTPDEAEQLADALVETAARLRVLGQQLAELLIEQGGA
ncbi:DUF6907 domain-containing protein [Streptomyces sp. NPDC088747]|uniref:DUF6907 domain-containing protein n=1 Tax=Streptomyces sp. NPDC088747 TaxID=3365886 RepID=UPI0037FD0EE6